MVRDLPLVAYPTAVLADEVHERQVVERLVLRYLLQNPSAADSASGISAWWLRDAGEVNPAVLDMALEELRLKGWLLARGENRETRIYSLNAEERQAAERYAREVHEF